MKNAKSFSNIFPPHYKISTPKRHITCTAMTSHCIALFLFTFLFFSQLSISFSATKFRCHPNDYKALMKIKQALTNPMGIKQPPSNPFSIITSWVPNTDCCGWNAIECDKNTNRVVQISIGPDTDLTGQISDAIGDLPYLTYMGFSDLPNLTGSIPESVTKLKYLKFIWLRTNALSGPVPEFLSKLPRLEYLALDFNQFSGPIPPSFSNLKNLSDLYLGYNRLTGPIPPSFSNLTKLSGLFLNNNKLTGTIPELFRHHINTRIFMELSYNQLTGPIPKSFANIVFERFNVSNNRLCGEIPTIKNINHPYDDSAYIHNKCLCGSPLSIKCK